MTINDFVKLVTKKEKGKKEVNIAQTKEIFGIIRDILHEKTGINIYEVIRHLMK